jgi:hypothetical protein
MVTVMRVAGEALPGGMARQAAAAIGWLVARWVVQIGRICLAPRPDEKAGSRDDAAARRREPTPMIPYVRAGAGEVDADAHH